MLGEIKTYQKQADGCPWLRDVRHLLCPVHPMCMSSMKIYRVYGKGASENQKQHQNADAGALLQHPERFRGVCGLT